MHFKLHQSDTGKEDKSVVGLETLHSLEDDSIEEDINYEEKGEGERYSDKVPPGMRPSQVPTLQVARTPEQMLVGKRRGYRMDNKLPSNVVEEKGFEKSFSTMQMENNTITVSQGQDKEQ